MFKQDTNNTSLFYLRLEEASRLLEQCRQAGIAVDDLLELPAKRQREWAAERLLLRQAFGRAVTLDHDEQGAPHVEGSDVNVSISHTPRLVVLACSLGQAVGVDAEAKDRRQVLRVRDKFLNEKEKQFIAPDDLVAHVMAWTAKEAVIKAERISAIDWTDGIVLEPFVVSPVETVLTACCGDRCFRLISRELENHFVTLAIPALG